MPTFEKGMLNLIKALQDSALKVSLPIFVLVGIGLAIWFSFANEQSKGRIKGWYITLIIAVILIVIIPVMIPWVQGFFK